MHKDFSFEDLNFKQETTEHLLYSMIEVLHDAGSVSYTHLTQNKYDSYY